jgi:molybdopterin adenylyltransferase
MPIDEDKPRKAVNIAIITVSDTRTIETDVSGLTLFELCEAAGHRVVSRAINRDEQTEIAERLRSLSVDPQVDVIILTGGTGVTARDVTPEVLEQLCEKMIPGFGELFRMLSYAKIGTSTIQSRTCAGIFRGKYIFALPGSPSAVRDGWEMILKDQLDSRHMPCNFVELMPRLKNRVF